MLEESSIDITSRLCINALLTKLSYQAMIAFYLMRSVHLVAMLTYYCYYVLLHF